MRRGGSQTDHIQQRAIRRERAEFQRCHWIHGLEIECIGLPTGVRDNDICGHSAVGQDDDHRRIRRIKHTAPTRVAGRFRPG